MSRSGPRFGNDAWSPAALKLLLETAGGDRSAGDVSAVLCAAGHYFSRNAVIGKLARLRAQGVVPQGPATDQAAPPPKPLQATYARCRTPGCPLLADYRRTDGRCVTCRQKAEAEARAETPPEKRPGMCSAPGCRLPAQRGYPDGRCAACRAEDVRAKSSARREALRA